MPWPKASAIVSWKQSAHDPKGICWVYGDRSGSDGPTTMVEVLVARALDPKAAAEIVRVLNVMCSVEKLSKGTVTPELIIGVYTQMKNARRSRMSSPSEARRPVIGLNNGVPVTEVVEEQI